MVVERRGGMRMRFRPRWLNYGEWEEKKSEGRMLK